MSRARARGVRGAVVERVEVVVDGLDLGPLDDREAEAEEDVLELAARGREHVQAPDRLRRRARQRDVDAVVREPLLELGARELRRRAPRSAPRAPGAPRWRPCRPRRAARPAARRPRAAAAAARPCARGSARAAPRASRCRPRPRSPPRACARSSAIRSIMTRGPYMGRETATRRVISYSATVAAIAAFSESRRDRDRARCARRPPTTSAGSPSRSAPTSSVTGSPSRRARAAARPRVGEQRDPLAGQLARRRRRARARPRRSRPCSRAPPSARAGRRSPGRAPRTRRRTPAPSAAPCRRCRDRRRRAGTTHSGPAGAAPALLVDADHARARAERGDRRERGSARPRGSRRRRAPSRPAGSPRAGAPGGAAAAIRSSPSARNRPLRARSRRSAGGAAPSGGGSR